MLLMACADEPRPTLVPLDFDAIEAALPEREKRGRISDRIPDIEVTNQHGETLHFFEDLVRDRIVVVNFMYTTCPKICPATTSNLVRLHEALGRLSSEVSFLSVSLDPELDTPEVLQRYWKAFGSHSGWHYLTGHYEEIELLRRRMGVYDLDPLIDADKTQHSGLLTFGNDRDDRWVALPALSTIGDLTETVGRFSHDRGARFARRLPLTTPARTYAGIGRVESIASELDSLVIAHEDIPGLMPSMTMRFDVADKELLNGVFPGQRVDFSLLRDDGRYRIVSLRQYEASPTRRE